MGGNFGEFGDSPQIRQNLTRQLLVAPEISIFIATEFTKVYFAKCDLACYSPKFTPVKVSLALYGTIIVHQSLCNDHTIHK